MKMPRIIAVAMMFSLVSTVCYAKAKPAGETAQAIPAAKVNLNSAPQAELEKLPGVGPALAKKIIAGRPFASAADLAKAGVPAKTIDKITPQITVGGAAPAAKAAIPKAPVPPAAAPAAAKPATPVPKATAAPKETKQATPPPAGKGVVWVNSESKIYHKVGSKWYGKTKKGSYMSENEAIKAGFRETKAGAK